MSRKFYSGLTDNMINRTASGPDRLKTNFYWPDDHEQDDTDYSRPSNSSSSSSRRNSRNDLPNNQHMNEPLSPTELKLNNQRSQLYWPNDDDIRDDTLQSAKKKPTNYHPQNRDYEDVQSHNKSYTKELFNKQLKSKIEFYDMVDSKELETHDDTLHKVNDLKKRDVHNSKIEFYDNEPMERELPVKREQQSNAVLSSGKESLNNVKSVNKQLTHSKLINKSNSADRFEKFEEYVESKSSHSLKYNQNIVNKIDELDINGISRSRQMTKKNDGVSIPIKDKNNSVNINNYNMENMNVKRPTSLVIETHHETPKRNSGPSHTESNRTPYSPPEPKHVEAQSPNEARQRAHRHLQSTIQLNADTPIQRDPNRPLTIRESAVYRVGVGLPDL